MGDMPMTYQAIEFKTNDQGGTATEQRYSGIDKSMAERTYHLILADAATSDRPMHGAQLTQGDGKPLEWKAYYKEASE